MNNEILKVIKAVMPANADVNVVPGIDSLDVSVSWLLHDDPDRPNKRSKTIAIAVSHEAAQDFAALSDQADVQRRVTAFLNQKLAQFDPSNNAPKYEPPPVEKWVITSKIITG